MKHIQIISTDRDWITGRTFDDETKEYSSVWTKLNDEAWFKKFSWVVDSPKKHIKEKHGIDIESLISDDIENIFDGFHPDFHILLANLQIIFENSIDYVSETIKLYLGPVSVYGKDHKLHGKALINAVKFHDLVFLLSDTELKFKQKLNILTDILNENLEYDVARKRHVFEDISNEEIEIFLKNVINENDKQWEKAKLNPQLYNWFVGQAMKHYKGKIDAAKVMKILETLK
jgi:hypothetical protein